MRALAGSRIDMFLLAAELLLRDPEQNGLDLSSELLKKHYVTNIIELTVCLPMLALPDDTPSLLR